MKRTEECEPTAIIRIDELVFRVWLGDAGVRRIAMPAVEGTMAVCGEQEPYIRIDTNKDPESGEKVALQKLSKYLVDLLKGIPPDEYPAMDLCHLSSFNRQVLEVVSTIPWGEKRSYGWVAEKVQRPGSARAVGRAVAGNPVPMLVPCHRVVRSDGSNGGWSGPPGWKEYLLAQEGQGFSQG
jgi:O-6-methylguanine DNA methyltransferase